MKRFIVGIVHDWSLHRGFGSMQIDYLLIEATTKARALRIAACDCVKRDFDSPIDEYHWTHYSILFCEELTKPVEKQLRRAATENLGWYPLQELVAPIRYAMYLDNDGHFHF